MSKLLQLVDPNGFFEYNGVTLSGTEARRFPKNVAITRALRACLVMEAEPGTEESPVLPAAVQAPDPPHKGPAAPDEGPTAAPRAAARTGPKGA